jgi:hypothetical protein
MCTGCVEVGVAFPEVFARLLSGKGNGSVEEVICMSRVSAIHLELPVIVEVGI